MKIANTERPSRRVSTSSFRNTAKVLVLNGHLLHRMDEDVLERLAGARSVPMAERVDGSLGQDLPPVDDGDLVADPLRLGHDVGREYDRESALPHVADQIDQPARGHGVEARGGLVEDQDLGLDEPTAGLDTVAARRL